MRASYLDWVKLNISGADLERGRRSGDSSLLEFPFSVPAIRALSRMRRLEFHPEVTFFIGENGSGKSTLLEAIADKRGHDEEGGTKNFRRGSHSEPFAELRSYLTQSRGAYPGEEFYLRAESFYSFSQRMEELGVMSSYGGTPLLEKSHGEGFMALLSYRLEGKGLYLFDEPEAALSVQSQFAALGFMRKLVQKRSQFIIATHSPILLAYPDAWIYRFSEDGIERVSYEQCEPYVLTRSFLENPRRMMERIFGADEACT